jgi:hypothetical protein
MLYGPAHMARALPQSKMFFFAGAGLFKQKNTAGSLLVAVLL